MRRVSGLSAALLLRHLLEEITLLQWHGLLQGVLVPVRLGTTCSGPGRHLQTRPREPRGNLRYFLLEPQLHALLLESFHEV